MIDKFTRKAYKEGYKARSVFKLDDINKKYKLIRKNQKILDLGCWPGSWLQYCKKNLQNTGLIVGIDTKEIKDIDIDFIKKDVFDSDIIETIKMKSSKFDLILSDLAPKTTGFQDSEQSIELAERALFIAEKLLKFNGNFVVKVFQGKDLNKFIDRLKKRFRFVKSNKPLASKKTSKEIYIVCIAKRW